MTSMSNLKARGRACSAKATSRMLVHTHARSVSPSTTTTRTSQGRHKGCYLPALVSTWASVRLSTRTWRDPSSLGVCIPKILRRRELQSMTNVSNELKTATATLQQRRALCAFVSCIDPGGLGCFSSSSDRPLLPYTWCGLYNTDQIPPGLLCGDAT